MARTRLIHRHSLEARLFDFLACGILACGILACGILSVRDIFYGEGYGLSPQERGVDTSPLLWKGVWGREVPP